MLIIRKKQMDKFREYTLGRFEERMVDHLRQLFPERFESLGESQTRELVRYSTERAAGYGFITEHDVALYATLTYSFGPDFHADPEHPWAASVLGDGTITDPTERIERLYETAIEIEQDMSRARNEAGRAR